MHIIITSEKVAAALLLIVVFWLWYGEHLCKDASCRPQIYLNSVVVVAVHELRRPIVSSWDIGHTSPRVVKSVVVVVQQ